MDQDDILADNISNELSQGELQRKSFTDDLEENLSTGNSQPSERKNFSTKSISDLLSESQKFLMTQKSKSSSQSISNSLSASSEINNAEESPQKVVSTGSMNDSRIDIGKSAGDVESQSNSSKSVIRSSSANSQGSQLMESRSARKASLNALNKIQSKSQQSDIGIKRSRSVHGSIHSTKSFDEESANDIVKPESKSRISVSSTQNPLSKISSMGNSDNQSNMSVADKISVYLSNQSIHQPSQPSVQNLDASEPDEVSLSVLEISNEYNDNSESDDQRSVSVGSMSFSTTSSLPENPNAVCNSDDLSELAEQLSVTPNEIGVQKINIARSRDRRTSNPEFQSKTESLSVEKTFSNNSTRSPSSKQTVSVKKSVSQIKSTQSLSESLSSLSRRSLDKQMSNSKVVSNQLSNMSSSSSKGYIDHTNSSSRSILDSPVVETHPVSSLTHLQNKSRDNCVEQDIEREYLGTNSKTIIEKLADDRKFSSSTSVPKSIMRTSSSKSRGSDASESRIGHKVSFEPLNEKSRETLLINSRPENDGDMFETTDSKHRHGSIDTMKSNPERGPQHLFQSGSNVRSFSVDNPTQMMSSSKEIFCRQSQMSSAKDSVHLSKLSFNNPSRSSIGGSESSKPYVPSNLSASNHENNEDNSVRLGSITFSNDSESGDSDDSAEQRRTLELDPNEVPDAASYDKTSHCSVRELSELSEQVALSPNECSAQKIIIARSRSRHGPSSGKIESTVEIEPTKNPHSDNISAAASSKCSVGVKKSLSQRISALLKRRSSHNFVSNSASQPSIKSHTSNSKISNKSKISVMSQQSDDEIKDDVFNIAVAKSSNEISRSALSNDASSNDSSKELNSDTQNLLGRESSQSSKNGRVSISKSSSHQNKCADHSHDTYESEKKTSYGALSSLEIKHDDDRFDIDVSRHSSLPKLCDSAVKDNSLLTVSKTLNRYSQTGGEEITNMIENETPSTENDSEFHLDYSALQSKFPRLNPVSSSASSNNNDYQATIDYPIGTAQPPLDPSLRPSLSNFDQWLANRNNYLDDIHCRIKKLETESSTHHHRSQINESANHERFSQVLGIVGEQSALINHLDRNLSTQKSRLSRMEAQSQYNTKSIHEIGYLVQDLYISFKKFAQSSSSNHNLTQEIKDLGQTVYVMKRQLNSLQLAAKKRVSL